jgi:hypothetical protein
LLVNAMELLSTRAASGSFSKHKKVVSRVDVRHSIRSMTQVCVDEVVLHTIAKRSVSPETRGGLAAGSEEGAACC